MKIFNKFMTLLLVVTLVLSGLVISPAKEADAAKVRLSKRTLTLRVGKKKRLKVYGTKRKITWRSLKKSVATVNSKGQVTAKKVGSTKICAKYPGTKLFCKIIVTGSSADTKPGGKLNPLSAYDENTISYYDDGKKIGTFKIKLVEYQSGNEAKERVCSNPGNTVPTSTQEYLYFQFQIKYVSGSEVVDAKDIFSYYYNIFDSTGTNALENIDWGFYYELMEDLSDVSLTPGNTATCSKAILVNKGNSPVIYRIRTGKNSYTWFTTEK